MAGRGVRVDGTKLLPCRFRFARRNGARRRLGNAHGHEDSHGQQLVSMMNDRSRTKRNIEFAAVTHHIYTRRTMIR